MHRLAFESNPTAPLELGGHRVVALGVLYLRQAGSPQPGTVPSHILVGADAYFQKQVQALF